MNIQQLNNEYSIADQLIFVEGKGGFPYIKINNQKASALVSVYAGQVLSYKPVYEPEDLLFISNNAYFQEGKAIKGGIPICWPWFGAHPKNPDHPDHGFLRNNYFSVASANLLTNGDIKIQLEFVNSAQSSTLWPYSFYLGLNIIIGDTLSLELLTRNTGAQAFSITEAFHSYFYIGDAAQIKILGLEQTDYLDKTKNFSKQHQIGAITLSEETDQIHFSNKNVLSIIDPVLNRKINITASGNKNVVVWNPWIEGSTQMADLENDDYKHFVCVETANAASEIIEILSGDEHTLFCNYSVSSH